MKNFHFIYEQIDFICLILCPMSMTWKNNLETFLFFFIFD